MLFIREDIDKSEIEVVQEAVGDKKSLYIKGPFMQAEVKNRNGRIYPKQVLEKAVNDYLPKIELKESVGELNHPNTPNINPERVSHVITELHFDGNNVIGKARVLESFPMGKIVKGFIDEGLRIGVSSRAMGSLREVSGVNYVQPDLVIATVDAVHGPSGPECFVNGIMENASWIYESGVWKQQELDAAKSIITRANSKDLVEKQIKLFEWLLNNVK